MIVEVLSISSDRTRTYAARVRFVEAAPAGKLRDMTQVGRDLYYRLGEIGGVDHVSMDPFSFQVCIASPSLWPWSEVEPAIVAALEVTTGERVELVGVSRQPGRRPPQTFSASAVR